MPQSVLLFGVMEMATLAYTHVQVTSKSQVLTLKSQARPSKFL